MPAHTQTHDSEEDDHSPSKPQPSIRAREMKSPLNRAEELIRAIIEPAKNAKMNASSKEHSKPAAPSRYRTCICSPTSHAGSFRCHLHRENQATKSSSTNSEQPNSTAAKFGHRHCSFSSPHLPSRFGRSSTTKSSM